MTESDEEESLGLGAGTGGPRRPSAGDMAPFAPARPAPVGPMAASGPPPCPSGRIPR